VNLIVDVGLKMKNHNVYPEYIISADGHVFKNGRELKQHHRNGYCRVTLRNKHFSVHRLVAEAYLDKPADATEVNHIDGNKNNNNVSNLEWCTRQQNIDHRMKNNLHGKPAVGIGFKGKVFTILEEAEPTYGKTGKPIRKVYAACNKCGDKKIVAPYSVKQNTVICRVCGYRGV
jgi:hypothetical protein